MSGAPTWPNTSVNQAIGVKVGSSIVILSVANNNVQLFINGSPMSLGDGEKRVLPNDGDLIRRNNSYLVRDLQGNSAQIIVQPATKYYLDVYVGLGRWPTNVQGLLVNANNNVNAVVGRTGVVYPAPFNFATFYSEYGTSWLVTGSQSLFESVTSHLPEVRISNPTQPFYATQLPNATYQSAKSQCQNAGVKQGALEDCILDVAVIGDAKAAQSHVTPRFTSAGKRATVFVMAQTSPKPSNN